MRLRIGIHLGDVVRHNGEALGSQSLKNVGVPMSVYALSGTNGEPERAAPRRRRWLSDQSGGTETDRSQHRRGHAHTKYVDKASPALMLHCANGKHIPNGLITIRKAGEHPLEYLKIKLSDIIVSGVQHSGHGGGDLMSENLTLNFAEMRVEYQEQSKTGGPEGGPKLFGWNVKANEKL